MNLNMNDIANGRGSGCGDSGQPPFALNDIANGRGNGHGSSGEPHFLLMSGTISASFAYGSSSGRGSNGPRAWGFGAAHGMGSANGDYKDSTLRRVTDRLLE